MSPERGFAGFPEGRVRLTPVPDPFFTELLPQIDHLGELKVTLYAFWALARQRGSRRFLRQEDLTADRRLLVSLAAPGLSPQEALQEALERAVARGTLLRVVRQEADGDAAYYFLNSPRGRAAARGLAEGAWRPEEAPDPALSLERARPNIFVLYEQNIGPLTPLIAEALQEAEDTYPASWIEEAFRIAVENNVRKWSYIQAILEDWHAKGKDAREDRGDTEKARRRYLESYSNYLES